MNQPAGSTTESTATTDSALDVAASRAGRPARTPPGDLTLPPPAPAPAGPGQPVLTASGVLCWRRAADGLEVLLVHRPAYDDWSFPKGKPHGDEPSPVCALRELAEETGVRAVLGRPLPGSAYRLPTGELKQVSYWAGRVHRTGRPSAPVTEVDGTGWVTVARARELLGYPGDVAPLDALAAWDAAGELETTPLLVVRHSAARPRDAWPRPDAERPLVAAGRRQAKAVADLLTCWRPEYLLSSPWLRCLETLAPYATREGLKVRTKGGLSENGYRRDPDKARRHTERLLQRGRPAALCTHRPVLAGVLLAVAAAEPPDAEPPVAEPTGQPPAGLAPGEVLVTHVVHPPGGPPVVVASERFLATG